MSISNYFAFWGAFVNPYFRWQNDASYIRHHYGVYEIDGYALGHKFLLSFPFARSLCYLTFRPFNTCACEATYGEGQVISYYILTKQKLFYECYSSSSSKISFSSLALIDSLYSLLC